MIEIQNVTRLYGKTVAVSKLDLNIHRGEIFGLLGSNGAGKSTTMKMVCGLLKPTNGTIHVGGIDVRNNPLAVKAKIGYLPENAQLYERLTGKENLELIGALRKLSSNLIEERIEYYSEKLGLEKHIFSEVGSYSKGMKQRLAIAQTLIHDPEVLVLDEPASGLDPRYVKLLKEWIRKLARTGCTIILSTHITEIAASLCDRIGIINNGRLGGIGTVSDLMIATNSKNLEDCFVSIVESDATTEITEGRFYRTD
ncbi:MAG: hypothetical protein BEU04_01215 [Marine Group III euryarchaeote CG-Bathy1]|uniref:ABC transporter domain-containing protein n=1 Tax=Marine Group III euryarchaeote CG-Bathy1 TaxID=1889001 RepID=A0A1J5TS99_9ARCH|nr:MAG: hypothetical protein BEU04_01215 [Marine Group III euryarchaeote CG-Bathy1]